MILAMIEATKELENEWACLAADPRSLASTKDRMAAL